MGDEVKFEGEDSHIRDWFAHADFEYASKLLHHYSDTADPFTRHCFFLLAVISYMRPFTRSRHVEDGTGRYDALLSREDVPSQFADLHKELARARNEIIAHTDLVPREPVLHVWTHRSPMWFSMKIKGLELETLTAQSEQFAELVKYLVKFLSERMDKVQERLEQQIIARKLQTP